MAGVSGEHRVVAQQHHRGLPEACGLAKEAIRLDQPRERRAAVAGLGEAARLLGLAEPFAQHRGQGRERGSDRSIGNVGHRTVPVQAAGIGAR